ncbi:MAG: hypothetical protein ACAI44_40135, partial [Candidatus Sericytochromatia bacterium]
ETITWSCDDGTEGSACDNSFSSGTEPLKQIWTSSTAGVFTLHVEITNDTHTPITADIDVTVIDGTGSASGEGGFDSGDNGGT